MATDDVPKGTLDDGTSVEVPPATTHDDGTVVPTDDVPTGTLVEVPTGTQLEDWSQKFTHLEPEV